MKFSILAASLALAVSAPALAVNLVTNPGFESGSAGWSFGGYFVSGGIAAVHPHSGNNFASTGCVFSYCSADQTIATTAGHGYVLDFYFNPGLNVSAGGASTRVSFGGHQVGSDIGIGPLGYVHYTYNVTATSSSTLLHFASFQNPAWTGLDDVSLTAVPEPASWALMVAGFGLVGAAARRRKSVAVAA